MKKLSSLLLIFSVIASTLGTWQIALAKPSTSGMSSIAFYKIDPEVRTALEAQQPGDMLTVIVTMRQQADLAQVRGTDPESRRQGLIHALKVISEASQRRTKALLEIRQAQGAAAQMTSFWGFNGFSVTATTQVIQELAGLEEVQSITPDDIEIVPAAQLAAGTPEANLSAVNAPALWNLGYYGQGVVVASLDTGVDISHPDLLNRWRGGNNSWYDPYGQHPTTPTDLIGHGTQTMGVMVGGDAGGTSIGVAPEARWIGVKIFNDSGRATATAIHLGFQWLLDPDGNPATADSPQVVNNSWAFGSPGCNLEFQLDLRALRALNILPVFSAGNYGPNSSTSVSPANYPEALAVGEVNNNGQIYTSSSRGPTTCGGSTGPYPEVVAPGVNIRTSGLYGMYDRVSGTSLSAPHVSGGLALLLSAYPSLAVGDQETSLKNSAMDLGALGPDDVYGYGQLDLLSAYNQLATASTATPSPTITPSPTPTDTPTPSPTPSDTPTPSTTPTETPTPSPTSTETPTPTFTTTPSATPTPATMHVGDLDGSATVAKSKWNVIITILIQSAGETPVANATVSGLWSNGATGTASCTTNSSGICKVSKSGLSTKTPGITFLVTNVSQASLTYLPGANHDPDGDSNGTAIDLSRP